MQADSLSFECPARAVFILSVSNPPRMRMEPRDSSPSPTVFDQPPRETEALSALETDVPDSTLADNMDTQEGIIEDIVPPPEGEVDEEARQQEWTEPTAKHQELEQGALQEWSEPHEPAHDTSQEWTEHTGKHEVIGEIEEPPVGEPEVAQQEPLQETSLEGTGPTVAHEVASPPAPQQEWKEPVPAQESSKPLAEATAAPPPVEARTELHPSAPREEKEKASQLGLSARESVGVIASARQVNLRRTPHLWKIMGVTFLANVLVLAGAGYWLERRVTAEITSRLAGGAAPSAPDASVPYTGSAQVEAILRRLADAEELNRRQTARLEELTSALAAAKSSPAPMKGVPATNTSPPPEVLTPADDELILLKERNRLTAYADESIATGARAPYERLWEALDDPRLANLIHAARSEILRVQNFYLGGSRIDRFNIPVATYYPENAALRDNQLKDEQLVKLLLNKKNPWEVRMKAANLLGSRRSLENGDALVQAVMQDDNLDVVKEATFSFEVMTGFHARIFDAAALEQWWKQFKTLPPPVQPKYDPANPKSPAQAKSPPDAKTGSDTKMPKSEAKTGKGKASAPTGKDSATKTGAKTEAKPSESKSKKQ